VDTDTRGPIMEKGQQRKRFNIRQCILIKSSVDDGNVEFIMLKCSLINIHVHHEYKPYNKMATPSVKYRERESL